MKLLKEQLTFLSRVFVASLKFVFLIEMSPGPTNVGVGLHKSDFCPITKPIWENGSKKGFITVHSQPNLKLIRSRHELDIDLNWMKSDTMTEILVHSWIVR